MNRLFLVVCLLLLCSWPAAALPAGQEKVLDNLRTFYKQVGMNDKVKWLDAQRKAGRIRFDRLPAKVGAECDIPTGVITVNSTRDFSSYQSYIELGETMCHEAVHQGQDPEGYNSECWRETFYMGNRYEQAAWAEGFRSIRRITYALKKKMDRAPSAREKAAWAARLKASVQTWQSLVTGWNENRGSYGDMVVVDEQGMPLEWDEMAREQQRLLTQAKDATVTSAALTRPYAGSYRGSITSGASGTFNFNVHPDNRVRGIVNGTYAKGGFRGEFEGTIDADGLLRGALTGTITLGTMKPQTMKYTGSLSGRIQGSQASGSWSAGNEYGRPSGSWSAGRQ